MGENVIDDPSKTFHSFRHTFKRACREAGITEEVHLAFTGHAGGGVGRSYGRMRRSDGAMDRGIPLERLKAEIDRLSYEGLVLPRWKPAAFRALDKHLSANIARRPPSLSAKQR